MSFFNNTVLTYTKTGNTPENYDVPLASLMPNGGYIQSLYLSMGFTVTTLKLAIVNTVTSTAVTFLDLGVTYDQTSTKGITLDFPIVYQNLAPLSLRFISTGNTGTEFSCLMSYAQLPVTNQLGFTTFTTIGGSSGLIYTNLNTQSVNIKSIFTYSDGNTSTSSNIEVNPYGITLAEDTWNLSLSNSIRMDVRGLILENNNYLTLNINSSSAPTGVLITGNILQ